MPFDGSGNFSRVHNWTSDRNLGINILASRMDAEFNNFSAGMNVVFFRNGLVPMSGNLNMGTNRIVQLGAGIAGSPSVTFSDDPASGVFLDGVGKVAVSTGSTKRLEVNTAGVIVTGTHTVSGNATVGGTLGVTGTSTLAALNATNGTFSGNVTAGGTLGVTGVATLGSATINALSVTTTLGVTTNMTVGGTLGVVGLTSLVDLTTSGNVVVLGTLGVTGATTLTTVSAATFTSSSANTPGFFIGLNSGLRNTTNGASTMNFDVSQGGATHGNFNFRSSSALSTRLYIDGANSRVGINTTAPLAALQVGSGTAAVAATTMLSVQHPFNADIAMHGPAATISSSAVVWGDDVTSTKSQIRYTYSTGELNTSVTGPGVNGIYIVDTAGAEKFRVSSTGVVSGNGDTNAAPATGLFRGTDGSGANIAGAELRVQSGRSTGSAAAGPLTFYTGVAGGAGSAINAAAERMRVATGGNVGIGETSPQHILDVFAASAKVRIGNATRRYSIGPIAGSSLVITDETGAAVRMTMDSAGKVGFGLNAPTDPLELRIDQNAATVLSVRNINTGATATAETSLVTGTANANVTLRLADASGVPVRSLVNGSAVVTSFDDSNTHNWRTNAAVQKMQLDSSGNLYVEGAAFVGATDLELGYRDLPNSAKTANYTFALADRGKMFTNTTGGWAIPANATVAFPIGTVLVGYNHSAVTQTVTITTDTLRLAGTATTGTRTVAIRGMFTLTKVDTTEWIISGNVI